MTHKSEKELKYLLLGAAFVILGSRLLECHQGPDNRKNANGDIIEPLAENHILGLPCIIEKKDNKRKKIEATLLLYEVNVKECCPACGMKPEGKEELMRCWVLDCNFRKSHIV